MATRVQTVHRLALSERIKLALGAILDEYAGDLDNDPNLRAVRIEVRVKPSGDVRAVVFDRQSEIADG